MHKVYLFKTQGQKRPGYYQEKSDQNHRARQRQNESK